MYADFSIQVFGPLEKGHRFVIRPFFAFRPVADKIDSSIFTNTEFFISQNQIRFLPYPDIPEIHISHSHGNCMNAPMWYHEFQYRNEQDKKKRIEDLLNPGFFELDINDGDQFYLSFGLEKVNYRKIPDLMLS